jgi:hypothetical protein
VARRLRCRTGRSTRSTTRTTATPVPPSRGSSSTLTYNDFRSLLLLFFCRISMVSCPFLLSHALPFRALSFCSSSEPYRLSSLLVVFATFVFSTTFSSTSCQLLDDHPVQRKQLSAAHRREDSAAQTLSVLDTCTLRKEMRKKDKAAIALLDDVTHRSSTPSNCFRPLVRSSLDSQAGEARVGRLEKLYSTFTVPSCLSPPS